MDAENHTQHIAVIGAGIIGLSCALWLKRKGFRVTVVDPQPPGSGTSSGSACTIAEYGCIPVNSPDLFRRLPSLLFAKNSPLTVNRIYALRRLGWMVDFLMHCRAHRVEHIINELGGLLAHTWDGLTPLLDMTEARNLIEERGFMHVYRDQREFDLAWSANQVRSKHGARFTPLDSRDINDLEPNLKIKFERGLLFDGIYQVLDPLALCERYATYLEQNNSQIVQARVVALREYSDNVKLSLDNGETIKVDQTIVAAGAFAKFIDGIGKLTSKLDTERGYHVLYRDQQHLLSRPVSWHFAGFYATPMNLGLRLAGTVEIAGYHKKQNARITAYLARKAHEMFDLPETPDQTWLGFRPTFPDSLPAIGYGTDSTRVIFAIGHHHLGLTLSGITGQLVAELASGDEPVHNISALSPSRLDQGNS
ncbi:MAG: cytochrome c4 [marine bacterium B5-7]|nr:MAG: cytochrome c4 [marine bacterium B5-7]